MKWLDKINEWKNGIIQKYPENITTNFFYETSKCDKNLLNEYKEKYIENTILNFKQDYCPYNDYIKIATNKYVIYFMNLSKDTLLIIPIPRKNKDYSTIKNFMDNATLKQQTYFWRKVAYLVLKFLQTNDSVYITTHGLGVHYFHLRLELKPKYYQTKEFI